MASRKKTASAKKFVIIGGCLIIIECVYLVLFPKVDAPSAKQAIAKAADRYGAGIDERRREQLKVQMAVQLYRASKEGKYPNNLNDLVPEYFDTLPIDPTTNKAFEYKIENGIAYIGPATDITGTAVASNKGASGSKGTTPDVNTQVALLEQQDESEKARFVYDPTGKRDPFRPFDFSPKPVTGSNLTPLEKYDIAQLKLTAVLKGFDEPTAIVENAAGRGFPVKKGTKIGIHGGEVVDILPDKLLILETTIDFTGEKKQATVELRLRTKDQEAKMLRDGQTPSE